VPEQPEKQREIIEHYALDFRQSREFARDPFIIASADGIRITDTTGKTYLDGLSGIFVVAAGHNNQAIIEAMVEQVRRLNFAPPIHGTNDRAVELVDLLRQITPPGIGSVKLLSGGSEATETAMKLARQYHQQTGNPRKYKVIGAYRGFHGSTMGAMSASGGWHNKTLFEPLGVGFLHVHPPYCYRCVYGQSYPGCGLTCANVLEETIRWEDPETVSAVILNPVGIGFTGFIVPPREFHQRVREICDRYNVVLIYDEVITGFGRTGAMFAADYYGVVPDAICCGKGMSSGYAPLAAVLFKDSIQQAFLGEAEEHVEFRHGHTFGGQPLAAAAGVANIHQLLERKLVENSRQMGSYLRGKLEAMYAKYPIVGEVRGLGLLQGMEFVKDRATKEPFGEPQPGKVIERLARERGLILRCGNEFVALAPPLIVGEAEIDQMCAILDECVGLAQRELLGGAA
jgi:adenosylmethionine-8-amino-7-oxononanoate aminotransferase